MRGRPIVACVETAKQPLHVEIRVTARTGTREVHFCNVSNIIVMRRDVNVTIYCVMGKKKENLVLRVTD